MRNHYTEIEYHCGACIKDIVVEVDIEGPSDYYYESTCPNCGKELSTVLSEKVYDAVVNHYASLSDYYHDLGR